MPILTRWLGAFILLSATFNPTQWNFVHWTQTRLGSDMPMIVLAGLLLLVGYVIYLRATLRSIGGFGMLLVAAILAALIWVLIDLGILDLADSDFNHWLGIITLSLALGIGLSWSIIRRRLSGQADVDDVED